MIEKPSVTLPPYLRGKVTLKDFIEYEKSWYKTNSLRGELIHKKFSSKKLTKKEEKQLNGLQAYADFYIDREFPTDYSKLEEALVKLQEVSSEASSLLEEIRKWDKKIKG